MKNKHPNPISKYLTPGERVLWKCQPASGHLFTVEDFFIIPFNVMFCTLVLIGICGAFFTSMPNASILWCIPPLCAGLYLVFGRFIRKAFKRADTIYVITDKRILSFRKNQVQTFDYHTHLTRKATWHQDGCGSIRFYSPMLVQGEFLKHYTPRQLSKQTSFVLDNITDVQHVFQILSSHPFDQ